MLSSPPVVPVVLAGGAGTRLWPVSRDSLPKQFQMLDGTRTLYQETLARVSDPGLFTAPVVLTREDFRFFAKRQAAEIGMQATVVLEPERRDTAPALIAGALIAQRLAGDDCLVLALAADHVVLDHEAFLASCHTAIRTALEGYIVTFGITPSEPRTSYGYIQPGSSIGQDGAHAVAAFVEKPDLATASRYIENGYLWNSGNFLFPAGLLIREAERLEPAIVAAARAAVDAAVDDIGFLRLDSEAFARSPAKSIDYAVMEKTRRAAVVTARFRWSDIGSWDAVRDLNAADAAGNITAGPVTLLDSRNSFVRSDGPLIAAVGLDGISVVATEDAVLVMPSDRAQDVKPLVTKLKAERHNAATEHLKAHRPWGTYQTVCRAERFHVKKIVVEPGQQLSLQKHFHRAEHWVVVKGTAKVTLDGREFEVRENESTYLPACSVHRLANPGKIPLELIEIQTGSYLGEDDIVRFADEYDRR